MLVRSPNRLHELEGIIYLVTGLTFLCLHDTVSEYFSADLHRVADVPFCTFMQPSFELIVPRNRLLTSGDGAFSMAFAKTCNS